MRNPQTVDYHVHYFLDRCAAAEMTLENIDNSAHDLGLTEVAILKHYSKGLPNNQPDWINWHRIIPEQFETFLKDVGAYQSRHGIRFFSGVETELVNEDGEINIESESQARLDMVALSFHYPPDLNVLKMDLMEYPPYINQYKANDNLQSVKNILNWEEKVKSIGPQPIIEGLVNAYIKAILTNPKIRTLSHMGDGIYPLDWYKVPVYDLPKSKQIELLEPLMNIVADHEILWETHGVNDQDYPIYQRAKELGVKFCCTVDAHFIQNGWANLMDHHFKVPTFHQYGIPLGVLKIDE